VERFTFLHLQRRSKMSDYIQYQVRVYSNGDKYWYLNGRRHRDDGPAVESSEGDKYWYLNGKQLTEGEFNRRMNPVRELTVEQISELLGFEVKVVK
jgi:hypothetical protein